MIFDDFRMESEEIGAVLAAPRLAAEENFTPLPFAAEIDRFQHAPLSEVSSALLVGAREAFAVAFCKRFGADGLRFGPFAWIPRRFLCSKRRSSRPGISPSTIRVLEAPGDPAAAWSETPFEGHLGHQRALHDRLFGSLVVPGAEAELFGHAHHDRRPTEHPALLVAALGACGG